MSAQSEELSMAVEYTRVGPMAAILGVLGSTSVICASAACYKSWDVVLLYGIAGCVASGIVFMLIELVLALDVQDRIMLLRDTHVVQASEVDLQRLCDVYVGQGVDPSDADAIAQRLGKYPRIATSVTASLSAPRESQGTAVVPMASTTMVTHIKYACLRFCSFVVSGLLPLIPYMFRRGQGPDLYFAISIGAAGGCLIGLGAMRSVRITQSVVKGIILTLVVGIACGSTAYGLGVMICFINLGRVVSQ